MLNKRRRFNFPNSITLSQLLEVLKDLKVEVVICPCTRPLLLGKVQQCLFFSSPKNKNTRTEKLNNTRVYHPCPVLELRIRSQVDIYG